MDYRAHYDRLMQRARNRALEGYVEVHHVLPRCLGGSDSLDNLVTLTAEEHYVAHQLLCKLHPNVKGLSYAIVAMTGNRYGFRNNKLYGWIRRKVALTTAIQSKALWADPEYRSRHREAMQVAQSSPAFKAKISSIHKGRVKSPEERANIAEAGRNRARRTFSDEAKKNMAEARRRTWQQRRESGEDKIIAQKVRETRIKNGSYRHSPEARAKLSAVQKGKEIPPETRAKISAALKGKKKSAEHVAKVAEALRKPKLPLTDEEIAARKAEKFANLSARSKGKKLDADHKAKISDGLARAYAAGMRRAPKAKLSDEQVREIRALVREITANQKEISERFGVSQTVISEIKTGKAYKHVK